ncbi:unnamed protein product [Paramecium pentaurelia]|uniref:Protein translocase subunit SecA n=1 Tax=Paramecium pentaurelia TaxID=43138 RepID=A0A8S1V4B9_9CILI|nr:unnamed protein product [Paramecium pentaurelia]
MEELIENNNWQIQDLFQEYNSINQRSNEQLSNLLQRVYSSLNEEQELDFNFNNFTSSPELLYEDLIFLCLKVKGYFSYYPRPAQLLAVIELYNHNFNQGRLAQIYTGEGKTLIIAMLAILLNQKKQSNVDVVTSSPVLATRDAEQLKEFYSSFSVTVSHNIGGSKSITKGMLPCYNSKVVYGDPHSFQADILRHEYQERGTMGNRKQEYIIVDEVDSMLIDGNSNKTLLSSPLPGMLDLTKVLRLIWDEICKAESNLSTEKKVMIIDEENYYSVDLKEYVESTLNLQLKDVLNEFIPKYRLNYIEFMKKTWIENAIQAKYNLHEDCHYKIENNNVRIIDFQNTGVIHKNNMQWEKGLHQFVQLKHNLPISPISINTNYLSNITFFKRYKNKILGLTGTLGSQVTQNLLAKQYNLDFVFMPPYKKRQLKEELGYAALKEKEWKDTILQAVQQQMNNKRAVLIINRTIQDVNKIQLHLQNYNLKSVVYYDDSQQIDHDIKPNSLIIATNLAGRGTDLITNEELEDNGGLHVIMSFLPRNIRIQQQGFGRTGRQGKKGTAQLIVNYEENLYVGQLKLNTIEDVKAYYIRNVNTTFTTLDLLVYLRNFNEKFYSDEIELEMKRLENEDRCFERFCRIAKSMVCFNENHAAFKALEEKWGLYLEEHQETGLKENEIETILNQNDSQNPKYLILQGLERDNLDMFRRAIQIQENDPSAYYYQGFYEIKQKNFQQGIQSLQKAKELFQNKIDDEKGFSTAFKLNRSQIEQFSKKLEEIRQSNNEEQTQMLPQLDLEMNSFQQSNEINQDNHNNISNIQNNTSNQEIQQDVNNQNIQNQNQNNQQKLDNSDSKAKNHIKVYEQLIQNINETLNTFNTFNPEKENIDVNWALLHFNEKNEDGDEKMSSKDKQEVINDGPLPLLGKVIKTKKERKKKKWWQYLAMFVIGAVQFVVGCAISALTCGAALPIGKTFIIGGISDMVYSVAAAWKGLNIDWGAWGQNKMINIASALVLAGPSGIKEALQIGGQAFQTIKQIGINEFLDQIPTVTADGLKKAGFWLSDLDKVNIQNQYQTLHMIQETALRTQNYHQILNLATEVIGDQVQNGTISESTGQNLYDLINQCFQQSKGTVKGFQNSFCELTKKYIKLQIAKCKTKKQEENLKQEVEEIQNIMGYKAKFKNINYMKQHQIMKLSNFQKFVQIIYSKDIELQKKILTLDLYFEKLCNPQNVNQQITSINIQKYLNSNFDINDQDIQDECNNVKIADEISMNRLYQKVIRPEIMDICNIFSDKCQFIEPIEIIFEEQYQAHSNAHIERFKLQNQQLFNLQQQMQNQVSTQQIEQIEQQLKQIFGQEPKQLVQNVINYMKNQQMINDDGITVSNQFMNQFKNFLNQQNYCSQKIQIMESAMQSTLQELENLRKTRKPFAKALIEAVEIEIIDEIEKYIFKSRIKKQDKILTSQYE